MLLCAAAAYLLQMRTAAEAEAEESAPPLPPAAVHQIGSFLVNVSTPGELRYLRVEVAAAIRGYETASDEGDKDGGHGKGSGAAKSQGADEELPTLQAADEAVARDLIVKILSASSFESLRTTAGREQAKQQIREALSQVLEDAEVESVLFLAFVMQ